MRRKCKWRENDFTRPSLSDDDWKDGWCLLITGGMMSEPTAVIEATDGTLHHVNIYNVKLEQDGGAEQERQWISVKDRLPDMCGCKCLVVGTNRFGQVDVFTAFTGYMERGKLEFHSCEPTHEIPVWTVTHWMPLPNPPAHCGRLLTEGSAE